MNCISEGTSDAHEENSSASSLSVSTDVSRLYEFHKFDDTSPRVSMNKALKSEAAFIDFVMSLPEELQRSEDSMSSSSNYRRGMPKTQASTSKVGLDHLDNLCKLMEQLGELRDNNNKLQKRVQYLEDLRTLHDMHKEIREGIEPEEEEPPPFKLQKSSTETRCVGGPPSRTPSKHRRSSFSARRERSKSVGHEEVEDPKSTKSIFPKWSRVKEALGWESERKDSVKIKGESYRQSIRRSSDESKSSTKRGNEEDSPPVLQSSTEEVHALIQRCAADNWRQSTCDKRLSLLEPPTDGLRRQKSTPSPGSDKITLNRQILGLKQKSLTLERDICSDKGFPRFDKDDAKRGKSPWGRVKTIIERRRDSLKRRPLRREPEKNLDHLEPLDICGDLMEDVDKGHSKDSEATPSSSPPFHRKSRWTRVKRALKGKREGESSSQSTPASPGEASREGNFNFDALEEMSQDSSEGPVRVSSEGQVHRLAVPNHALMLELERNLSDDFHRKIREWERIKKKPHESAKSTPVKPKLKDLAWLDKELRKIEKEKQRLSKERSKYEERAFRLEKLRETVLSARSSTKKEVLVRTSAGEFRFEGISDAFTKKLYEWETKRGVGPELSTIALLDSSCQSGPSQSKLSRSESSLAEVGQHSHNSSNSLPSLMPHDDPDRLNQHSRANSEPDLSTLVAFANGANLKGSLESLGCPDEICRSEEEDEDEAETARRKRKDSEKYYGLLEENVILLEQLKDKEEFCRRLEKELEMLDEKVEDMSAKHTQQMERYREKLWEMHKPGTSPTAVQSCLATIAQLRKRIETLEWCTEKLRNDRESIEDSFRYHSKQQETMTLDLLEKMRELQAAGSNAGISETQGEKQGSRSNLDSNAVERLQELSALLVKQTEELEATLSAKTRQICELRWELLHRDLSTVKLETELHTQTAHTKRTKYAHFRSLSSEEASSRHLQNAAVVSRRQNLRNKSLVGYSEKELFGSKEGGFGAKELSNTVHQLNRELLRLSSANETSTEDKLDAYGSGESPVTEEASPAHADNEIKVRRSSADNVNARWAAAERARSSSSDDSSEEESFTRVSWCSGKRVEDSSSNAMVLVRNREERLLMSPGEQHPGSRIQRRKRVNSGRKRFTAHPLPQKCQSFRETRERIVDDSRNISSDSKLNLRGSSTLRPEERVPKTLSQSFSCQDDARQKLFESVLSTRRLEKRDTQGIVESTGTSQTSEKLPNDRQRREILRREHLQRKRCKRWMKPAKAEEGAPVKLPDVCSLEDTTQKTTDIGAPQAVPDSTGEPTVTVLLPRRKFSTDVRKDINENVVETITLVMPRKRSLSSETDSTNAKERTTKCVAENDLSKRRTLTESQIKPEIEKKEASTQLCSSDLPAYHMDYQIPEVTENFINVQAHRKRKMGPDQAIITNDQNAYYLNACALKDYGHQQLSNQFPRTEDRISEVTNEDSLISIHYPSPQSNDPSHRLSHSHTQQMDLKVSAPSSNDVAKSQTMIQLHTSTSIYPPEPAMPSCCYKSPSAPQLDWKKTCAKKIVKEGAANVKNLIERYNQRAAGSPCTSNLSSPVIPRRANIPQFNYSPPPTPNIVLHTSSSYSPLLFKPTNLDMFSKSPPPSPASRARAEALLKAKEKFIASPPQASPILLKRSLIRQQSSPCETSIEMLPRLNESESAKQFAEEDRVSMDSVRLVVLRTGANCQESRRQTRRDQQQRDTKDAKEEEYELKTSKSLSSSSLFKSMLGNDFKTSFPGLLRLKKSRRKKDLTTVSQLCRQSLLLSEPCVTTAPSSARSCPSSPELKAKGEPKQPGWFHRNILRHK